MAGLITLKSTVTGATQFSNASPFCTFREVFTQLNSEPPNVVARIVSYGYNSTGAAHTVRLVLTPPAAATGGDEDIILEAPTSTVNSFSNLCGPDGIVVPRQYGFSGTDEQPLTTQIVSAETYQLFFSTVGKAAQGTLYVTYKIAGLEE